MTGEPAKKKKRDLGELKHWPVKWVKVADLKAYERNPRRISEQAYQRLKEKIRTLGFNTPLIATHDLRIIGGHQRTRILTELKVEKVQCSIAPYKLSDAQFKRALIENNISDGEFDIEMIEEDFEEFELEQMGFDMTMLPVKAVDHGAHWQGMPEFSQEHQLGVHRLIVHFKTKEDFEEFAKLVKQKLTEKTKYIWYPEEPREEVKDKVFVSAVKDKA